MEGYIILTRQCHLKEADLKIKLCWGPKNATFLSVFGTNFFRLQRFLNNSLCYIKIRDQNINLSLFILEEILMKLYFNCDNYFRRVCYYSVS